MAKLQPIAGQVVRVTTLRVGGEPMHVPYIVAEPDPCESRTTCLEGNDPKRAGNCPLSRTPPDIWLMPAAKIFGKDKGRD
jgi:hypothetical protein